MTENETLSHISDCLDQKLILLTKASDLTKRMEVLSRQKEIDEGTVSRLADERQVYIDRLKKCNALLSSYCLSLPEDRMERTKKIIGGTFPKEECTAEEAELLVCAGKCRDLLDNVLTNDTQTRANMQRECDRLQKLLQAAHRENARKKEKAKKS